MKMLQCKCIACLYTWESDTQPKECRDCGNMRDQYGNIAVYTRMLTPGGKYTKWKEVPTNDDPS